MKRIIFVGVHNKNGFAPLDHKTKTGEVITKISLTLSESEGNTPVFGVRTNLYNSNYIPNITSTIAYNMWRNRINTSNEDLIVCLGEIVHMAFKEANSDLNYIKIRHPGSVLRKGDQAVKEYIVQSVDTIKQHIH